MVWVHAWTMDMKIFVYLSVHFVSILNSYSAFQCAVYSWVKLKALELPVCCQILWLQISRWLMELSYEQLSIKLKLGFEIVIGTSKSSPVLAVDFRGETFKHRCIFWIRKSRSIEWHQDIPKTLWMCFHLRVHSPWVKWIILFISFTCTRR
jgi:hypothetical protein